MAKVTPPYNATLTHRFTGKKTPIVVEWDGGYQLEVRHRNGEYVGWVSRSRVTPSPRGTHMSLADLAAYSDLLGPLVRDGTITLEGTNVIGVAADGIRVQLGNTYHLDGVVDYLRSHPSPKDW